jgi:hypothetical protein
VLKSTVVALILTSLPGVVWAADAPAAGAAANPSAAVSPSTDMPAATPASPPVPPLPVVTPSAAPPPPPPASPAAPVRDDLLLMADVLPNPGYVPGYRTFNGFTLAPNVPLVGALPGNITPGFGAPMPPTQWTFKWSGFLNDSFQSSIGHRMVTGPDQTTTVFHIPAQTVDEYASFLGTNTMPGQWVQLNMAYGNPVVSLNLSLSTWNPTEPTTYYQIGSQNFIQNAYLQYLVPPLGDWNLRVLAGYFYTNYGALAQYGLGMYTNAIVALVRGVGEDVTAEYKLSPTLSLLLDEGFMGNRNGEAPSGTIPDAGNGGASANPMYPAAWIAHLHAGLAWNGPTSYKLNTHFVVNWAQDDRVQCQSASILVPQGVDEPCLDNPTYRQFNSALVPNGHLYVTGFDASVNNPAWGFLGIAGSYTEGANASLLRGLTTFGGEGGALVDRWWGSGTYGSGSLYAGGLNYTGSLRRILSAPLPARRDAPDLIINAGAILAYTTTSSTTISGAQTLPSTITMPGPIPLPSDVDQFNHRLRWKLGADALYTWKSWVGAGLRVDRVAPTNKDADQTFWVVAPRIVFKTNWFARESLTLLYARWFYGSNTHPDASSIVAPDGRLDDQLIALNVNVWW